LSVSIYKEVRNVYRSYNWHADAPLELQSLVSMSL
jgi:hypothetical protein